MCAPSCPGHCAQDKLAEINFDMLDKAAQMKKAKSFDASLDDKPWLQDVIKSKIGKDGGSLLDKPLQVCLKGWAQHVPITAYLRCEGC